MIPYNAEECKVRITINSNHIGRERMDAVTMQQTEPDLVVVISSREWHWHNVSITSPTFSTGYIMMSVFIYSRFTL